MSVAYAKCNFFPVVQQQQPKTAVEDENDCERAPLCEMSMLTTVRRADALSKCPSLFAMAICHQHHQHNQIIQYLPGIARSLGGKWLSTLRSCKRALYFGFASFSLSLSLSISLVLIYAFNWTPFPSSLLHIVVAVCVFIFYSLFLLAHSSLKLCLFNLIYKQYLRSDSE